MDGLKFGIIDLIRALGKDWLGLKRGYMDGNDDRQTLIDNIALAAGK